MKRPGRFGSILMVMAVATGVVLFLQNREPRYDGVSLSVWLARLQTESGAEARDAIRQIGPGAVPFLIRRAQMIDSPFRLKILPWLAKCRLIRSDWQRDLKTKGASALLGLEALGPDAATAIPELVRLLPKHEFFAATILAGIGPEFGRHPAAKQAIPILIAKLGIREPDMRDAALGALRAAGPAAIPQLLGALNHTNDLVRERAASLLGKCGTKETVFVPLTPLLRDEKSNVRLAAANALSRFGPDAAVAIPEMRKLLHDADSRTAIGAAMVIGRLHSNAQDVVAELIERLNDRSVCAEAASALGQFGPAARDAVPALMAVLNDCLVPFDSTTQESNGQRTEFERKYHGLNVALALGNIGSPAEAAIPVLITALGSKEDWIRRGAAQTLGRFGRASIAAMPKLLELLDSKEKDVRGACVRALTQIDPCSEGVYKVIAGLLADTAWEVREVVASTLPAIARCADASIKDITNALAEALRDQRHEVRMAAVRALGELAPSSPEAVRVLEAGTKDGAASVRDAVSSVLKSAGRTGAKPTQ